MVEFRRSLHTADSVIARQRCLSATIWFREMMDQLRTMPTPTREDLEKAARQYFQTFARPEHRSRGYHPDRIDEMSGHDAELAREGIKTIDDELISNDFGASAYLAAKTMLFGLGVDIDEASTELRQQALRLGARAVRELSELTISQLTNPVQAHRPSDSLFNVGSTINLDPAPAAVLEHTTSISGAVRQYQSRLLSRNLKASAITETARVLKWLGQEFGGERALSSVTTQEMRLFRDRLFVLDKRLQGRDLPFSKRVAEDPQHQLTYATAIKYWRSLCQFFSWAAEDRLIHENPTKIAAPPKPKGIKQKSPEAFQPDEIQKLLKTPLYAGHQSPHRLRNPGTCRSRNGEWWSGLVFMHTGLRAGELAQLMPSDFDFKAAVPHLKVREISDEGTLKSVKNAASVRDVPIHPTLLNLGLEPFVKSRAKRGPKERVFSEFRLGINRSSEGTTRFWGDYLRAFDLWKHGRSTHVWRHTVVARLRANSVAAEDIAAIVGHAGHGGADVFAQTKAYGGDFGLDRKLATILKLDFGFDVQGAVD